MHYCGMVADSGARSQLCDAGGGARPRAADPAERALLRARRRRPRWSRELRALGDVVVGVGRAGCARTRAATASWPSAACRRCAPRAGPSAHEGLGRPYLPASRPRCHARAGGGRRLSPGGRVRDQPDGVFAALQGRRAAGQAPPVGIQRRIQELVGDHVIDEGGNLWHRRIEEIEAACALWRRIAMPSGTRTGLVTPPRAWWYCRERACRSASARTGCCRTCRGRSWAASSRRASGACPCRSRVGRSRARRAPSDRSSRRSRRPRS